MSYFTVFYRPERSIFLVDEFAVEEIEGRYRIPEDVYCRHCNGNTTKYLACEVHSGELWEKLARLTDAGFNYRPGILMLRPSSGPPFPPRFQFLNNEFDPHTREIRNEVDVFFSHWTDESGSESVPASPKDYVREGQPIVAVPYPGYCPPFSPARPRDTYEAHGGRVSVAPVILGPREHGV